MGESFKILTGVIVILLSLLEVKAQEKEIKDIIVEHYSFIFQPQGDYEGLQKYLKKKKFKVYDDQFTQRWMLLKNYMKFFDRNDVKVDIEGNSVKILGRRDNDNVVEFDVIFNRIINTKKDSLQMIIGAKKEEKSLKDFKILKITHPGENDRKLKVTLSSGFNYTFLNGFVVKNLGAIQPSNSLQFYGLFLASGFRVQGIRLLGNSELNLLASISKNLSGWKWENLSKKSNVIVPIQEQSLRLQNANYLALTLNYKQIFFYWVDTYFDLSLFALIGYKYHFFTFQVDKENNPFVNNLRLNRWSGNYGLGIEFLPKSRKVSFFANINYTPNQLVPKNDRLGLQPQSILDLKLGVRLRL